MHALVVIALLSTTLAFSLWLTHSLSRSSFRWQVIDHPNERSLHTTPTPRTGGVAVVGALVVAAVVAHLLLPVILDRAGWVAISIGLVATTSYLDDHFSLPAGLRLVIHSLSAIILIVGGFRITDLGLPEVSLNLSFPFMAVLTGLFIVWMINLYNFMDGMDGFAGGMTVIGFGALALAGWMAGDASYATFAALVAAAAGGFLIINFPPARIFMGDIGSSTLGLLAAAFSLWAAERLILPLWASLLVFSPFVIDATFTLIRRLLRGERIWQAHRTHIYQRLVRLGWGHRKTVLWEYLLMLVCAICALWGKAQPPNLQWITIGVAAISYVLIILIVGVLEKRRGGLNL